MKHFKYYRIQQIHTKTHHQHHLKTLQTHSGTPQNTSNRYKHQQETFQNTSHRIEMIDKLINYIDTAITSMQSIHMKPRRDEAVQILHSHRNAYENTSPATPQNAMTTDASCDFDIESVLTCVENEPAYPLRHIRQQRKQAYNTMQRQYKTNANMHSHTLTVCTYSPRAGGTFELPLSSLPEHFVSA